MSSIKRIKRRIPGGKTVIKTKERKLGAVLCAKCKRPLFGSPRRGSAEARKLSKTQRNVSRIYGGYLCLNCTKELVKERARSI